jgi:hypothetical protein
VLARLARTTGRTDIASMPGRLPLNGTTRTQAKSLGVLYSTGALREEQLDVDSRASGQRMLTEIARETLRHFD